MRRLRKYWRWGISPVWALLAAWQLGESVLGDHPWWGRIVRLVLAAGLLHLAIGPLRRSRPHGFRVDAHGLSLTRGDWATEVLWSQVASVILYRGPAAVGDRRRIVCRLLLVPVAGAMLDRALVHAPNPVDGRPCRVLLDLAQVKDTPDQIAAMLATFGGDRFLDHRTA
ncbi:hypothetical protein [Catellatospora paridis]|uniref:hypothetical protein n=1 Tax=Catellatospora paridis TaxID=1617086 RepID=UPI0012D45236|nr:hypothetical protein [Catellatospora paridis]